MKSKQSKNKILDFLKKQQGLRDEKKRLQTEVRDRTGGLRRGGGGCVRGWGGTGVGGRWDAVCGHSCGEGEEVDDF